jgi:hypothetical protein
MKNYGITWTDPAGTPRVDVVSYDERSADDRKKALEAAGCTDVAIVETKPGQRLEPAG